MPCSSRAPCERATMLWLSASHLPFSSAPTTRCWPWPPLRGWLWRIPMRTHEPTGTAPRPEQRASEFGREEWAPDVQQLVVATAGALLIGVLFLALPPEVTRVPSWLLLVVEALLLAPPFVAALFLERALPYPIARGLAFGLLAVLTAALIGSVSLLIGQLGGKITGRVLIRPAGLLWASNVLVFAIWYWETDGGGPRHRFAAGHQAADFKFPQQDGGNPTGWAPGFVDYLFLAFCTATALSPADTYPLTRGAKLLMMAEAVISGLVLVLLIARSINII